MHALLTGQKIQFVIQQYASAACPMGFTASHN